MVHEGADAPVIRAGIWSRQGEFLSVAEVPVAGGREVTEHHRPSASRDPGEEEVPITAHRFPGGYRVRVRKWWGEETEMLWLAPVEEGEESYMGLFSEEEMREVISYLVASPETPGSVGVRENVPRPSGPEQS